MTTSPRARSGPPSRSPDLYRAVWRWHFYAGLLVLPFLIWLAITGSLYVFKAEIDGFFHQRLMTVAQVQERERAPTELTAAALAAHPGALIKYTPPPGPTRSAEALVSTAGGERLVVFVDPYRAQVLGTLPDGGSVAWTIRKLHSLKYFSPIARGAIEIAAGWAILLVLTGIYLWWPRGRQGGVVSVRGAPAQRVFWRDLHAVTGLVVGGMVLFLALTGMPWSVFWGNQINQWANGHNYGYPAGVRVQVPMSELRLADGATTTWSLQQAKVPESGHEGHESHEDHDGHSGHDGHEGHTAHAGHAVPEAKPLPSALTLDQAVAAFDRLGLAPGYAVQMPRGPRGVYSGSVYPADLSQQRVVHLDQYSGKPLLDMSYAHYGPMGRVLEWGINVHLGMEWGVFNQALLVAACLGIVLLCVSAGVMWWKRRPAGRLGVPPPPANRRLQAGVLALLLVGGAVFPLVGASMLVMALLDWLAFGRRAGQTPA